MAGKFDAEDKTFEDVFKSSSPYRVPSYQRPYSWESDQLSEFWEDVEGDDDADFIGSLIFNFEHLEKDGCIDIIDGQQRLLTTSIFLAALRDQLEQLGTNGKELAARIHRRYIVVEDIEGEKSHRIIPGNTVRDFFATNIQSYPGKVLDAFGKLAAKPKTTEEWRVVDAYIDLSKRITAHLAKFGDESTRIEAAYSLLRKLNAIRIIQIEIWNEVEAYQIFETVNARGVDLSVADLLKNLLFKKIAPSGQKQIHVLTSKWSSIEKDVRDSSFEMAKFVRYFWLSKYSFVTEKKLFREIRKQKDFSALVEELRTAASDLRLLVVGDREDWDNEEIDDSPKILSALEGVRTLGVKQCYVLFLSLLRNRKKMGTSFHRLVAAVEKFSFTYSYICNQPTNKVERLFSRVAREIEAACETAEPKSRRIAVEKAINSLISELASMVPPKEVFERSFAGVSYGRSEKDRRAVKYILGRINDADASGEMFIDFESVNIEHILPQRPAKEWGLTSQEIRPYVNLIGNLTLVHKKINSQASNKSIEKKLEFLAKSKLPITQNVVGTIRKKLDRIGENEGVWNQREIEMRHALFSVRAYDEIWKIRI